MHNERFAFHRHHHYHHNIKTQLNYISKLNGKGVYIMNQNAQLRISILYFELSFFYAQFYDSSLECLIYNTVIKTHIYTESTIKWLLFSAFCSNFKKKNLNQLLMENEKL